MTTAAMDSGKHDVVFVAARRLCDACHAVSVVLPVTTCSRCEGKAAARRVYWLTYKAGKYQFVPQGWRVRVRRYEGGRCVREEFQPAQQARELWTYLLELGYSRF
jgi:hypothetical protein